MLLCGHSSVHDKKTKKSVSMHFGLPYGFDGPMHPFGLHVDLYNATNSDPVHYANTKSMQTEISEFANACLPILKTCFHYESLVLQ